MNHVKGFASDNHSGIHPEIMEAIVHANVGHVNSYGEDSYSELAEATFKKHFGDDIEVFFVFNGTAANVLSFKAVTRSYHSIISAETAHIHVDECGAPEMITGCKVITLQTDDGKLSPGMIKQYLQKFGDQHHSQPKVITIAQSTELGTVYSPSEIRAIAELAHQHGMFLHMDGSRISNAATSLNISFKEMTTDVGVDILSFGGTKNGLMVGEAVVFLNQALAVDFKYIRKQAMQLGSKMRFIATQFHTLLENDLWLRNATHANKMATLLANKLASFSEITITQKVESNAIFAILPEEWIPILQKEYFFHVWEEGKCVVRLMTSFDTTADHEDQFIAYMEQLRMENKG